MSGRALLISCNIQITNRFYPGGLYVTRFRNVLRFAGVPVDSSEPVRRQYGSRMIGIVTVCLLPLLVFDVPLWVFVLSQVIWGAGVYIGLSVAGDKSGIADAFSDCSRKNRRGDACSPASPLSAFRLSTILSPAFVDRYVDTPLSPDVAEGLPPAASVSRPVGYGTGVLLSPGVVESVRQSLALLRNALQAAFGIFSSKRLTAAIFHGRPDP
jgi:uncharacterized membrane protein